MAFIIKPRVLTEFEYPLITESQRACETNYEGEKKIIFRLLCHEQRGKVSCNSLRKMQSPKGSQRMVLSLMTKPT